MLKACCSKHMLLQQICNIQNVVKTNFDALNYRLTKFYDVIRVLSLSKLQTVALFQPIRLFSAEET